MAAPRLADGPGATRPMTPHRWRLRRRTRETADTWTLELEPTDGAERGSFAPGQFNMLYAFPVGEVPISICGYGDDATSLLHTVRAVGAVTEAICELQPGSQLGLRGPYGSAWPLEQAAGGDLLLIAGGLGLAPLRPALQAGLAARGRFREVALLYGGREPEQLLYREEIDGLRSHPRLQLGVTVDNATAGWTGQVGVVTKLIARAEFDPSNATCLICGPEVMMRFAIRALRDRGLPAERIFLSIERNMKCAVTQCGRCQFGPTFACREGPVMRFSDIEQFFELREV
jgi:NAD(P)H-flavin reductase